MRFGLPLVLFAVALFGPVAYADYTAAGGALGYPAFFVRVFVGEGRVELGHLWFLAHLLVYGAVYVLWRALAGRWAGRPGGPRGARRPGRRAGGRCSPSPPAWQASPSPCASPSPSTAG